MRPIGTRVRRDEDIDGPIAGTPSFVEVTQRAFEQFRAVVRTDQYRQRRSHGPTCAFSPNAQPDKYPMKYTTFISLRTVALRPRELHSCNHARSARQSCGSSA